MVSSAVGKRTGLVVMLSLSGAFFWHWVYRGRGKAVVRLYEQRQNEGWYSRVGLFMMIETHSLPFVTAGIVVLWQRL